MVIQNVFIAVGTKPFYQILPTWRQAGKNNENGFENVFKNLTFLSTNMITSFQEWKNILSTDVSKLSCEALPNLILEQDSFLGGGRQLTGSSLLFLMSQTLVTEHQNYKRAEKKHTKRRTKTTIRNKQLEGKAKGDHMPAGMQAMHFQA